jgi:site-specific recombinase XerD
LCKKINAKFSITYKCWYVDYSKENYHLIQQTFEHIKIEKNNGDYSINKQTSDKSLIDVDTKSKDVVFSRKENSLIDELKFSLQKNIGKYWVFELRYHYQITPQLKKLKGVYWNQQYKCYFAVRTSHIKKKLENILGQQGIFPEDFYVPNTQFKGEVVSIYPHEEDTSWIAVVVPLFDEIHEALKRIPFYRYHKEKQCYLFPATPSIIKLLQAQFIALSLTIKSYLPADYAMERYLPNRKRTTLNQIKNKLIDSIPEKAKKYITQYTNHLLALNYSPSTLDSYTKAFIRFLKFYNFEDPRKITQEKIIEYLANLMLNGLSSSSGNTMVNALKMYYHNILGLTQLDITIPRPKREKKLPVFLSEEEVKRLFSTLENMKHKLLLLMAYGAGLRVGELVTLKWDNIRWDMQKIHIKGGKGKKDRMVMLPSTILTLLKKYRKEFKPKFYIFEGQFAGMPYSTRSVQAIMRKAVKASGLELKATPHALRHSFATHLIEKGTDIRYIQELLGHKEIKTTMIYTHVTDSAIDKIQSPLDGLVALHKNREKDNI